MTAVAAFWGISWTCGRVISGEGVPAIHGALGRFAFGSAGLLAIMLASRPWPSPRGMTWLKLLAMGAVGVLIYNICFFNGLRTVPAGRASLMASLQPSVVFLFSVVFWRERVTALKIAGLAVSFAGAVLVLAQGDPAKLFRSGVSVGDLWVLGCVGSWIAYTLLGRSLAGHIPVLAGTAYSTWMGTAMLAPFAIWEPAPIGPWSFTTWIAIAFLGICGTTIAFVFFVRSVGHLGAPRTSIFINLVPVFGVLSSSLLLGETIGLSTLLGGLIVIAGVRMLNL